MNQFVAVSADFKTFRSTKLSLLNSPQLPFKDEIVEYFTKGNCWLLASVFSHFTDLELAFVTKYSWDQDCGLSEFFWNHVMVHIGDGKYLDVHGVHTKEQVAALWGHRGEYDVTILHCDNDRSVWDVLLDDPGPLYDGAVSWLPQIIPPMMSLIGERESWDSFDELIGMLDEIVPKLASYAVQDEECA